MNNMTEQEREFAKYLRTCPHCGKQPIVEVIDWEDPRVDEHVATWWRELRNQEKSLYRIMCCALMEDTVAIRLSAIWNRRDG